jgi:TPR repeat protein
LAGGIHIAAPAAPPLAFTPPPREQILTLRGDDVFAADAGEQDWEDAAAFAEDPRPPRLAPQAHVQALVRDFQRRQRQANLIVAGSIAAACVLTVAGLIAVASLVTPSRHQDQVPLPAIHSTSIAWQRPAPAFVMAGAAQQIANRSGKSQPLVLPARAALTDLHAAGVGDTRLDAAVPGPVIMVQPGRPLALSSLLPQSKARYVLLRGLPAQAQLSAGQRNDSGAWMVRDDQLADLRLEVNASPTGPAAFGDYPVDIYLLGTGKIAQARHRLVLRVESVPGALPAAAPNANWPAQLLDLALMSLDPGTKAVAPPSTHLLVRARQLLGEGDIAGARLLLRNLAEQGDSEGAYELARSFDAQVLAELGVRGLGGDPAQARGWYEQASESGNAQAAERLKILASLSD